MQLYRCKTGNTFYWEISSAAAILQARRMAISRFTRQGRKITYRTTNSRQGIT